MAALPIEFEEKMKKLLGKEYEDFMASYDCPRNFGLRVNVDKISPEEFEKLAPFHLTRIPWTENGYYYEEQDMPARHPFYYAGMYYLQEPSAMTPASRLVSQPGDRVLDLCAAPGGKATELGAHLHGKGVLVANDISASRAKALLKNIEVFGIRNSFVVNEVPAKLAENFPEFFDKILVDAPCSGEGMFRKDPAVAKVWDGNKPFECAKQQKEIITRAAQMLAPGGDMLYSTCTFSPEENEQVIQFLLDSRDDMEIRDIKPFDGFAPGRPEVAYEGWDSPELGDVKSERENPAGENRERTDSGSRKMGSPDLKKCVRIWPHKMAGEGHFLALLHKRAPGEITGTQKNNRVVSNNSRTTADEHKSLVQGSVADIKGIGKPETKALTEFFTDVSMEMNWKQVEVRKGQVYLVPEAPGARKGLVFLRNGLYLGEIRKDRFEPSQSFAMALKKKEYTAVMDLDYSDVRVEKYLRGETLEVDDIVERNLQEAEEMSNAKAMKKRMEKGWQLVCVNGYPLGWGKLVNGILKNKYHAGWRMKY